MDDIFLGIGAVIRSGKVIGDNVNIRVNAPVAHNIHQKCVAD